MKWIVKKVIVSKVNSLLDAYKGNVEKAKDTLKVWIDRLDKIITAFKSLLKKLDDNKIDSEEIDQTVAEIEEVIKSW